VSSEESKAHELVIIRRRLGEGDDKHHGGVWKIAYADFMTAMMAFFLVMWLINSTDKKTLTQVATYFNPMRLTDKRPTPKGLNEADLNDGRQGLAQKGANKKRGDSKGPKKVEDAEPGEVRSRGKPKNPTGVRCHCRRQSAPGGRARLSRSIRYRAPLRNRAKRAVKQHRSQRSLAA
jgi:chemotaxis protein MotB